MQDGTKNDISWATCFQYACDKAVIDTYKVKARTDVREIVDTAVMKAEIQISASIKAAGGFDGMNVGKFVDVETMALKTPVSTGPLEIETLHASKRLLSHMREFLAYHAVTVPDNYSAYSAVSKLPSILGEAQANR